MEHLRWAPALPKIIRLGRKGMQGTNNQTYCEQLEITAVKSYITFGLVNAKLYFSITDCGKITDSASPFQAFSAENHILGKTIS